MSTAISATKREKTGSSESRRLRRQGIVPGNLYGLGEPQAICTKVEDVTRLLRDGARVLDVELDGKVEPALFKEIQWDALGSEIQHVDFLRIDPSKRIDVEVPVEVRGVAPGVVAGGILDIKSRRVAVNCLAVQVPESVIVRVGGLKLGESIFARDVELAEGVKLTTSEDTLVVQVTAPTGGTGESDDALPGPAEPELIGRKADDEAGDS